jgi:hypothetical protein
LLSFRGISTPSLPAQGEQRRSSYFNIPRGNSQRDRIVGIIPTAQRHRHFGSMQSSQAIAQSVFGTISAFGCLPLLADVAAEDGMPAFGPILDNTTLIMEHSIKTLGEPRPTSIDVWLRVLIA